MEKENETKSNIAEIQVSYKPYVKGSKSIS
jgi:hypothetical protein